MRILGKVAIGALACILGFGSVAIAQGPAGGGGGPPPPSGPPPGGGGGGTIGTIGTATALTASLDAAITAGDVTTINALIAANKGDPTATALIATILFASAQATTGGGNTTGGALLAALAVSTGGLTGNQALLAQNLVLASPTVVALITNANAPNTGGITSATLAGSGTVVASNTPAASNPSQACTGSC